MELKVWVEGIQRIVCGVTETTTCQDVVFALAHATGKSGRFTLIERWRNNERQLAPSENPLKILMKWGEYSNDVQFILQWNEKSQTSSKNKILSPPNTLSSQSAANINVDSPVRQPDLQKSLPFSGNHMSEIVGIVKGVPHIKTAPLEVRESFAHTPNSSPKKSSYSGSDKSESPSQRIAPPYKDPPAPPPYRDPPPPNNHDKYKKNILQVSFLSIYKSTHN